MGHKHQAAITPLAGLQDLQLDGLGAMGHIQANDAFQHIVSGHNWRSRGLGWGCGREQLFGPLALLGHAANDLASPAHIEDHPFAGNGLDQAQQGGLAVLRRLDQGVPQGLATEIRTAAFQRAQAGEHEHGLLEQGGSHRTIGHLGEAQRHWLIEQGEELPANSSSAGPIHFGEITRAGAEAPRVPQFPHSHREIGVEQGKLDHNLLKGPRSGHGHQGGEQGPQQQAAPSPRHQRQPCTEMR